MAWQIAAAMLAAKAAEYISGKKNRQKQIELANTAHQREVKDLIRAGLNPILSANRGAPVPHLENPAKDLGSAASSAIGLSNLKKVQSAAIAHTTAQTAVQNATAIETAERARLTGAQADIKGVQATMARAAQSAVDWLDPKSILEYFLGRAGSSAMDAAEAHGPTVMDKLTPTSPLKTKRKKRSYSGKDFPLVSPRKTPRRIEPGEAGRWMKGPSGQPRWKPKRRQ